jgi:hypothetical protein
MEVLKSLPIEKRLKDFHYYDLTANNERLGVILSIDSKGSEDKLQQVFSDIITNRKINWGYYQLRMFFINCQAYNPKSILNLLISAIEEKVDIIYNVLKNEETIQMGQYIQIWAEYTEFCKQLYYLLNAHQKFLTERNIKISNISNNILSIVQLCAFYNKIFSPELKILDHITKSQFTLDSHNIDQFVNFIGALRVFLSIQKFTEVNKNKLIEIIQTYLKGAQTINFLCGYVNKLLWEINDSSNSGSDSKSNRLKISTVYKIASMLAIYGEREPILVSHSKFMKVRITNPRYKNLELEIEFIKRISGAIGKYPSQKLLNTVSDIIQNQTLTEILHKSTVKIVSEEYAKINILPKIITPLILVQKNWEVPTCGPDDIVYPLGIKYCLDVVSKFYSKVGPNDLDCGYFIQWNPLLGRAKFEAEFKNKTVIINCNFLQAMLLSYLNEHPILSCKQFAEDTHLDQSLSEKLIESLANAELLVSVDSVQQTYVPNFNNYVGNNNVDLHSYFVETFDPQKAETVAKSKFSYVADDPEEPINSIPSILKSSPIQHFPEEESGEDIPIRKPSKLISSDFTSDESDDD